MKNLEKYLEQDIFNPIYLFHGSPFFIEQLEPKQSTDNINEENNDKAVFLTSWFINATAYAFRNKLKEVNDRWSFLMNNNGELPAMCFQVENIPDDLYGYIYVFKKDNDMIKDNHEFTTQYRCYHSLKPIDVVKVYYKDFSDYFEREVILKKK